MISLASFFYDFYLRCLTLFFSLSKIHFFSYYYFDFFFFLFMCFCFFVYMDYGVLVYFNTFTSYTLVLYSLYYVLYFLLGIFYLLSYEYMYIGTNKICSFFIFYFLISLASLSIVYWTDKPTNQAIFSTPTAMWLFRIAKWIQIWKLTVLHSTQIGKINKVGSTNGSKKKIIGEKSLAVVNTVGCLNHFER